MVALVLKPLSKKANEEKSLYEHRLKPNLISKNRAFDLFLAGIIFEDIRRKHYTFIKHFLVFARAPQRRVVCGKHMQYFIIFPGRWFAGARLFLFVSRFPAINNLISEDFSAEPAFLLDFENFFNDNFLTQMFYELSRDEEQKQHEKRPRKRGEKQSDDRTVGG
jgi:hypothetical protein